MQITDLTGQKTQSKSEIAISNLNPCKSVTDMSTTLILVLTEHLSGRHGYRTVERHHIML